MSYRRIRAFDPPSERSSTARADARLQHVRAVVQHRSRHDAEEVLNIVEAYGYVSYTFNNDLIDDFRRMVEVTIEQNASNLQSPFLLKYLETQPGLLR